jgi:hypothetical protein
LPECATKTKSGKCRCYGRERGVDFQIQKGSDDACLTKGIDLRVNVGNDGIEKDW